MRREINIAAVYSNVSGVHWFMKSCSPVMTDLCVQKSISLQEAPCVQRHWLSRNQLRYTDHLISLPGFIKWMNSGLKRSYFKGNLTPLIPCRNMQISVSLRVQDQPSLRSKFQESLEKWIGITHSVSMFLL